MKWSFSLSAPVRKDKDSNQSIRIQTFFLKSDDTVTYTHQHNFISLSTGS